MKTLISILSIIFLCSSLESTRCSGQSKFQFSVNGKSYTATQYYADLKKNDRREYTLTIHARGGELNDVQLFIYDAMSTMPPLHSDDPPMKIGDYTNDKNTMAGGMFSISFTDNSALMSNEQVKPAFTLTLSKLDIKNGLVSGTFQGPMDHISSAKQEQVSGGVFTDIPIKKGY